MPADDTAPTPIMPTDDPASAHIMLADDPAPEHIMVQEPAANMVTSECKRFEGGFWFRILSGIRKCAS